MRLRRYIAYKLQAAQLGEVFRLASYLYEGETGNENRYAATAATEQHRCEDARPVIGGMEES